jgi:hypothetical protein
MQRKPQKQSMLDGRWQAVFLGILLVIVVLLEIFVVVHGGSKNIVKSHR